MIFKILNNLRSSNVTQQTDAYPKSTIEIIRKGVKHVEGQNLGCKFAHTNIYILPMKNIVLTSS